MTDIDYQILSAMLSPALFMTATGSVLMSANNRMSRVVDRLRTICDTSEKLLREPTSADHTSERLEHNAWLIEAQTRRAKYILTALTALYGAFTAFVGTSLTIALDYLSNNRFLFLPVITAISGVVLLLVACGYLLSEVRLAVQVLQRDTNFRVGLLPKLAAEQRSASERAQS
jgi:hypothetical protein